MQKISGVSKYLGIPSLAVLIVGGGATSGYWLNARNNYRSFIDETYRTVPVVKHVDALESASKNLQTSENELTYYLVRPESRGIKGSHNPAVYHYPNVDKSLKGVRLARADMEQGNFPQDSKAHTMIDQVQRVETKLEKTEKGESQDFYSPIREKISHVHNEADELLTELRQQVPNDITQKRESLKKKEDVQGTLSLLFSAFGALGLWLTWMIRSDELIKRAPVANPQSLISNK